MSRQSFVGDYRVQTTYGTQFGLDTVVSIRDDGSDDTLAVSFQPPGSTAGPTLYASYDPATDALHLALADPTAQMFISQIVETDYRAIYGVVIFEQLGDPPVARLAVWGANASKVDAHELPPVTDPSRQQAFIGSYRVEATAGAQFGAGSTVTIGDVSEEGTQALAIVNALGQPLDSTPPLSYDAATGALRGVTVTRDATSVRIWMSLAHPSGTTTRVLYGCSAVDDPEQAATWAGDDDGGG